MDNLEEFFFLKNIVFKNPISKLLIWIKSAKGLQVYIASILRLFLDWKYFAVGRVLLLEERFTSSGQD